jgi:hypothetical protein
VLELWVLSHLFVRGGGGGGGGGVVLLRSWPLGEMMKGNGQKTHNLDYILSQRSDGKFWHDMIRHAQIWAVKS